MGHVERNATTVQLQKNSEMDGMQRAGASLLFMCLCAPPTQMLEGHFLFMCSLEGNSFLPKKNCLGLILQADGKVACERLKGYYSTTV